MYESRAAFKVPVIDQPPLWSHALRGLERRGEETPALGAPRQSHRLPSSPLCTARSVSPFSLGRAPLSANEPLKPTPTK